jgi:hypothetical protein
VPKWAGTDKAVPLHEFFETSEIIARIGNCSQEDMIRIAILKLTELFTRATRPKHNVGSI